MQWKVVFHPEFKAESFAFAPEVQDELLAEAAFVEMFGPETGRPHVDTLKGSDFKNMKELRFEAADGEWRCAFAFDPKRQALLLVCGDKTFYRKLIAKADKRFKQYLAAMDEEEKTAQPNETERKKNKSGKGKRR